MQPFAAAPATVAARRFRPRMAQLELFPEEPDEEPVLSVSQLTALVKDILEAAFPSVWVSGEISNYSRPGSGHSYFTLKDEGAQLPAIVWRTLASRVRFDLHDGLEVVCRGRLELYAPRGRYQLIVDQIEPKGLGALELAFRQLYERLAREGLFAPQRKRRLPPFVRRIAVITSPTGAAIRDFLEVLRRRWRGVDVWIVPVRVQGAGAAEEVAAAIRMVNRLTTRVDCLVVTRGGGSLEDLWAFNEEVVVRAVHGSRIPVISAIGHEIDVTLCDLVADLRALTPSEAAERVAPAAAEIAHRLTQHQARLAAALAARLDNARNRLERVTAHRAFRKPFERTGDLARRLDELDNRAECAMRHHLRLAGQRVESTALRLESLSPLAVLSRGYSLSHRQSDQQLIRDAAQLSPGDIVETRFAHGRAISRVERTIGDS